MDPRADLNVVAKVKIFASAENQIPSSIPFASKYIRYKLCHYFRYVKFYFDFKLIV